MSSALTNGRLGTPFAERREGGLAQNGQPSEDFQVMIFGVRGTGSLEEARNLSSRIEGMDLPSVVAASPVKMAPGGSKDPAQQQWAVRVVYEPPLPQQIPELSGTRPLPDTLAPVMSEGSGAGGAFVRLGIVSFLMWVGIIGGGGYLVWKGVQSLSTDPNDEDDN